MASSALILYLYLLVIIAYFSSVGAIVVGIIGMRVVVGLKRLGSRRGFRGEGVEVRVSR
jgi:hypothetical protein